VYNNWQTAILIKLFSEVSVYVNQPGMHVSDSPQATIPLSILIILYHSDIVFCNKRSNLAILLELWIKLNILTLPGIENKERESSYQELQSEFDCLEIPCDGL